MTEMITIECRPCMFCGKKNTMIVPHNQWKRWRDGEHIQYASVTHDRTDDFCWPGAPSPQRGS